MIRNNLAKLMIDRGISATQLFNDTGIARSTISKISNNNTDKISLQTIDKICNYLEVNPSEFFDFWAYDVRIKCGFNNFENLSEVKEYWKTVIEYSEPCFLLIEFSRGKNIKKLLEYKFNYKYEYIQGMPDDTGYLDNVELDTSVSETSIFDTMPIQFQNELVEQVKELLCKTFDVWEFSPTIKHLDVLILNNTD